MELQRDEVRKEAGGHSGLLLAWFVLLALGTAMMTIYAHSPGASRDVGPAWPADATFSAASDRPTLVAGLHPRCTCSVATVRELERVLAGAAVRPRVEVLVYRPAGAEEGWHRTAFDEELRRIPEVTVRNDIEGRQSQAFGMQTSGDVALFTPGGRLLFRGGVTQARGHEGESEGGRRLRIALSEGQGEQGAHPVFGCSLGSHG